MYHIKDVQVTKGKSFEHYDNFVNLVHDMKLENVEDLYRKGEYFYYNEALGSFGWFRKSVQKPIITPAEFIERFGKEKKKIEPRAKQLPLITDEESVKTPCEKKYDDQVKLIIRQKNKDSVSGDNGIIVDDPKYNVSASEYFAYFDRIHKSKLETPKPSYSLNDLKIEEFAQQLDEMSQVEKEFNGIIGDQIVNSVIAKYDQRSRLGVSKYGTTLEDNTDGLEVFLTHLQEELMDATLYIEKLKQKVTQFKNIF